MNEDVCSVIYLVKISASLSSSFEKNAKIRERYFHESRVVTSNCKYVVHTKIVFVSRDENYVRNTVLFISQKLHHLSK